MRPEIGSNPRYAKRSEEDKDAITAGTWQNYSDKVKRRLRGQYAGKDKTVMNAQSFMYLRGYFARMELDTSLKSLPSKRDEPGWPKSPPKGYPTDRTQYADPANFKYPLDSEDHVRAAWSYINMPKNRAKYEDHELATMENRIKKAGAKYDIDFSEKDFGGWTSQNLDWERGFREGERKAEDRQRGIETQRTRTPQLQAKQGDQTLPYSDPNNPVRVEQRRERQAGLRQRAGERKLQHQEPGTVVANVTGEKKQLTILDVLGPEAVDLKDDLGPLSDPEKHGKPFYAQPQGEEPTYTDLEDIVQGKGPIEMATALHLEMEAVQDHPGVSCDKAHPGEHHVSWAQRNKDADAEWKQFYGRYAPRPLPQKIKRYGLFAPFEVHVATKSVGYGDNAIEKGDLVVECFVSAPIKDLQGDILDVPALMQAKQAMVRAPTNRIWLDHESPYAKPIENQGTPPIGKFVESKIVKVAGVPALWAKWIVNKAHPQYKKVAYELQKGFYNAMSMEFIPDLNGQMQKMIGNKLVNVINSIKYFATSLVRAPANEMATITRVYQKNVGLVPVMALGEAQPRRVYERAFANSSRFMPIRVKSLVGFGQYVMEKEENLRTKQQLKEAEPENEPEPELEAEPEAELELEAEPEDWTDQEAMPQAQPRITAGQRPTKKEAEPESESESEPSDSDSDDSTDDDSDEDGDGVQEKVGSPELPYSRKDYDRETGYVAPERATTAIGEWGDPALEKARLAKMEKQIKRLEGYAELTGKSINRLGVYAQRQTAFLKAIAKSQGIDTKGIDEGLAPDTLGVYDGFKTITDEQEPPEVPKTKLKPRPQRFIATFPTKDEDVEYDDSQEVGGEPVGVKGLDRRINAIVTKALEKQLPRKIVVRKGYAEHAGPVPESVRRMQAIQQDNGSLESQLDVNDLAGGL
jgi:hypothetical protein